MQVICYSRCATALNFGRERIVVERLTQSVLALQKELDVDETGMVGYSAAGGLKVVVKIPEDKLEMVKVYLVSEGVSESEAEARGFTQGIEWFGIVDGKTVHQSLIRQGNRPDPFQDFKWIVTVINWQPISVLKPFSRARKMLQSSHVVEISFFDTISGVHEIVHEKAKLSGESFENMVKEHGAITKIADEFSGGSHYGRQTTRTLTGAALRIKPEALNVLGKIMKEENPALVRRVIEVDKNETLSTGAVFDARAYKNLVSTNTMLAATEVLNANSQDQSNALLKLKSGFEDNGFKCFQSARLNREAERSAKVRHQIRLMNKLIGRAKWPVELSDVERKLLLSSHFDAELDKHDVGKETIMKSLVATYRERMPLEAGIRWRLHCREQQIRGNEIQQEDEQQPCQALNASEQQQQDESEILTTNNPTEGLSPLGRMNIRCFNMGLERYSMQQDTEEEKFHLVNGDPTQLQLNGTCKSPLDVHQADKCIPILKPMMDPHGWIFFYTRAVDFSMWNKAFRSNGFEPLEYPWTMIRDSETV